MAEKPDLQLIQGGGEIVGMLEDLLERARAGTIDVLAIALANEDGGSTSGLAFKRGAPAPWPRILGATAKLQYDLLAGKLHFEDD